eukprot:TRINITY_DN1559_c0_g1_i2.p1 TRINITY_DN1559_c0_g1~~TRINITY_DN1559_c0_g1_i2.p1  ORF type:complete len:383 (+),score=98.71 TRINITY_DN1559_c0_g1_i2:76-1224(+)
MSESKTKKRDTKEGPEETTKEKKENKTKENKKNKSTSEGLTKTNDETTKEKKSKHREERGKKKQKLIEALPEELSDSDSDDEETEGKKFSRVGYLEIKKKDRWKPHYCCLIGGSFFYYRTSQDMEPQGTIHLKGSTIKKLESSGDAKKKWVLEIKTEETTLHASVGAAQDLDAWVDSLKSNSKLEQSQPPTKEKSKKQGRMTGAKKKIAGNVAVSTFGKSVIKKVINDETAALLISIRKIVKKESNAKKADELEKNIIKLAVKSYLLIDKGKLRGDDFLIADSPLREAFELLIKCFNGRGRVETKVLSDAFKRVEGMLHRAETVITNLLAPHLTPKNMFRISSTFGYLGNAEFLEKVFKDQALEEELEKLIDAMEYYTQFHY